jgi:hypothetical protein
VLCYAVRTEESPKLTMSQEWLWAGYSPTGQEDCWSAFNSKYSFSGAFVKLGKLYSRQEKVVFKVGGGRKTMFCWAK